MSLRGAFCATKQPPVEEFRMYKKVEIAHRTPENTSGRWGARRTLALAGSARSVGKNRLERHVIDLSTYFEKTVGAQNLSPVQGLNKRR